MLTRIEDRARIYDLVSVIESQVQVSGLKFSVMRVESPGYLALFMLDQHGEEVLEFPVLRESTGGKLHVGGKQGSPSAAFVSDGDKIWLAHSGRVHRTKQKFPAPDTDVLAGGKIKKYFIVSDMEDKNILLNMITFHLVRSEPDISIATSIETDDGPFSAYIAKESKKDPKHHLVVKALRKHLLGAGFVGWKHRGRIRCDCAAEIGGQHYIFEVKPTSKFNDVCEAVGQLFVYRNFTGEDPALVLVAPSGMSEPLASYVSGMGIVLWPFDFGQNNSVVQEWPSS